MQETIEFMNELADASGKIIKGYFRKTFEVDSKAANDPVTEADKAVETELRRLIADRYPDDALQGEEFGKTEGTSRRTWVIDPIDGTKAFAAGRATFATLVALCIDGIPAAGLIDQPIVGDRWIGAAGMTTYNGHPCHTRSCADHKYAAVISTSPDMFQGDDEIFAQCIINAGRFVTWGGDCYGYGLIASGFADVQIEARLKAHDIMPLVPIIQGAGGIITDWNGEVPTLSNCKGNTLACGDHAVHQKLLALGAGGGS